jgi:hypothetical protein
MLVLAGLNDRSSTRQEEPILIGQCEGTWSYFANEHSVYEAWQRIVASASLLTVG